MSVIGNCRPVLPAPGEVHLWHLRLDESPGELAECHAVLNDVERARAARFFRKIHRDRFTVGRGRLRMLLGTYLGCPPESLTFAYNDQGKPALEHPAPPAPFSFNLSHSDDVALCAIAGFETVGVDVEALRESRDLMPIARRFFSVAEQAALQALPPVQQCPAFYQCWSSKEALLKAWGTGLTTPLDRFDVRVAAGEAAVLSVDIPEWARTPWQLYPVTVPEGYAAALALPGPAVALSIGHWPTDHQLGPRSARAVPTPR